MSFKSPRVIPAFAAVVVSVSAASTASAALVIINGNFEDTSGLAGGSPWYMGVPVGWNGLANNYTIGTDGVSKVANIEQLSSTSSGFQPFYQDIGTLDVTSDVTLTFTLLQPWNANPIDLGVAIWPGADYGAALAFNSHITSTGTYTLTAANVPAGTPVRIGFWRGNPTGSPGIDNVSISALAVPEPSSFTIAGLGLAVLLSSRRRAAIA